MNDDLRFTAVLAEVLAHSVVYFAREASGAAWGVLRADLSPSAPPPRDLAAEGAASQKAQIDLMPERYAADAEYLPKYLGLDLSLLKTAAPELVSLLQQTQPGVSGVISEANRAQRTADIEDVMRLGPQATAAFRASDPQKTALIDQLNVSAMEGLKAGGGLTPNESLAISEDVGAASASRGLGFGPADVFSDAIAQDAGRNTRLRERQQFGTQIAALDQATGADPFLQILGRPSQAGGMAAGLLGPAGGLAGGGGPRLTDPFNAYAGDLYNTNYNADAAARIAGANNDAAIVSGAMSY